MIQQSELITFLVGLGVAVYLFVNRRRLDTIPHVRVLLGSYSALLAGWALTILEGFFLPVLLNAIEHLAYAVCSVLVAVWSWITFEKSRWRE